MITESSRDEDPWKTNMNYAYRVPGANEIFNTNLKAAGVLWLLINLFRTRHDGIHC